MKLVILRIYTNSKRSDYQYKGVILLKHLINYTIIIINTNHILCGDIVFLILMNVVPPCC